MACQTNTNMISNYTTIKLQDNQSKGLANLNEIKVLNIS